MDALLFCMSTKLSRMYEADVHAKEQLSYLYIFCQNCIHDFAVIYIFTFGISSPTSNHSRVGESLWMWVMKDIGECTYL
mgnify:CR=1 FL=1